MSVTSWSRFGAIAGILFAVLFTLGVILPDLPSGGDPESVVDEFYADSGNRMTVIVAAYLIVLAGLAFRIPLRALPACAGPKGYWIGEAFGS